MFVPFQPVILKHEKVRFPFSTRTFMKSGLPGLNYLPQSRLNIRVNFVRISKFCFYSVIIDVFGAHQCVETGKPLFKF